MKLFALVVIACFCTGRTASADDQVRRIQEALRKRNLYFGEVDGRKTDETTGAIRRFQQRQGLPPTGEVSAPTLASLGLAPLPPGGPQWPEGPVLRSDAARELPEREQQKLEALAESPPVPIAEPPLVLDPTPPPPRPTPVETAPLVTFVRDYLTACTTNRLPEEMRFYGDAVSYFDHGTVDDAFIARDVQRFYKRWPNRKYDLLDCKVSRTKTGDWETMFRIAFHYNNGRGQAAEGKSVNIFKVREDSGGMHFVSMKEQLLRD